MRKKTNYAIIIFSLLLFVKCSDKTDVRQIFLEENFLTIVDTIAYSRGSLVTQPSDTIRYPKLSIKLLQKITYHPRVEEYINNFFEKNIGLKQTYKDVLTKGNFQEISLNSNFPKNIGKYEIFFNSGEQNKSIKYAGEIGITNIKIFKNKAILVLSESVGHFGRTYIVLLIEEHDQWKVIKKEILWLS